LTNTGTDAAAEIAAQTSNAISMTNPPPQSASAFRGVVANSHAKTAHSLFHDSGASGSSVWVVDIQLLHDKLSISIGYVDKEMVRYFAKAAPKETARECWDHNRAALESAFGQFAE
jgi:hypothetical protein